MPEHVYLRKPASATDSPDPGLGRYCAYNQTRECFLCSDIEAGDFSPSGLETRLRGLGPGSDGAFWIMPFRGISPTSVRIPVDLLYLDQNSVVLEAVESFPISRPASSGVPATSVLALPANTIASAGTRAGDRLILCAPAEMKRRVQQLLAAQAEERSHGAAAPESESARNTAGRVLPWVDRSKARLLPEAAPVEALPAEITVAPVPAPVPTAQPVEATQPKPATKKGWLSRLLNPEPPQPRKAQRDFVHGLAAFYFTGSDPAPHTVRDISSTGIYLLTDERWYLGTVIRMSLTHLSGSPSEKSIMVYASVVRWANDGVGLAFVFAEEKGARGPASSMGGATRTQVQAFIETVKGGGQ